jgi:DHA3 family macrolide efflux protein-like MFS transporter
VAIVSGFVSGFMFPIMIGPVYAIVQATVDPAIQGRVLTVMNSLFSLMSPLSLVIAGPVSDLLGVQFWYVMAGVLYMLIAVGITFVPSIMRLEDYADPSAAKEPIAADSGVPEF